MTAPSPLMAAPIINELYYIVCRGTQDFRGIHDDTGNTHETARKVGLRFRETGICRAETTAAKRPVTFNLYMPKT